MKLGYTLMTEQSGPRELVRYAQGAEAAGFDFEVSSDHYFPWLASQGHSPYAWSVLGAVAQVTERVELMTYVTCPTRRYHPAVVAQKAATMGVLSEGRFTLGLGSGENLNEHVVGAWPAVEVRQDMLVEAIAIISELLDGAILDFQGEHFQVHNARLWDLPDERVRIAAAVSGERGIDRFAPLVDDMVAVAPEATLVEAWDAARGGSTGRKIGQLPICWGPDEAEALALAHDQFRWSPHGWRVNAELPGPVAFAQATTTVRPEDVAEAIACGPDLERIVENVKAYADAGFTDLALLQVGDQRQEEFLEVAEAELLPRLREALGTDGGDA
ncbi:TIGR03557 family F420-dependent LLM class oxidoreductase [Nocardioides jishulii]|uniref:TIGR03557 family F420-dependent LLM class oxidoreductase n=1 Tax=Nocardioides jishulii TaxID=2575440 RepID=A0A4U2YS66_9ACTN|nr:TIGR03557 family F420-dependent LLM class oxidoreductase [Nocardioides jishulii]QCX28806.1 TIGR03557 family F420-dependent LLM class oxidoreductase [Nocardioides jishulii]TKI64297.1 TIGR03557 family F420-dependent LLM class oxidoreductase [Nocardioides jishulii]